MRHALVENTKIVNIIEIDPRNASDFKNAVTIPENIFAGIGDSYRDGRFYRCNEETQQEEEILPYDPMAEMQENMDEMVSASVSQSLAASPMMLGVGDLFQAMSPTLQTNLPESAGSKCCPCSQDIRLLTRVEPGGIFSDTKRIHFLRILII